jgi:hypothetical protein
MLFQVGPTLQVADYTLEFRLSRSEQCEKNMQACLASEASGTTLQMQNILFLYHCFNWSHFDVTRQGSTNSVQGSMSLQSYFLIPPRLTAFEDICAFKVDSFS